MENKQTAVEWLVNELENHHVFHDIKNTVAYQQAKEMHKEESISYAKDLAKQMLDNKRFVNAEIIYNETFGGNNEQTNIKTTNMQQTATTQLYLKLQQIEFYYQQGDLTITEFIEAKKDAFLQAEETFKQQIESTAQTCFCEGIAAAFNINQINTTELIKYAEEYYNDTYGKENTNN